MAVLFLHAAFDRVCETRDSQLSAPMGAMCGDLSATVIESGHWTQQERPEGVNACLAALIARRIEHEER